MARNWLVLIIGILISKYSTIYFFKNHAQDLFLRVHLFFIILFKAVDQEWVQAVPRRHLS